MGCAMVCGPMRTSWLSRPVSCGRSPEREEMSVPVRGPWLKRGWRPAGLRLRLPSLPESMRTKNDSVPSWIGMSGVACSLLKARVAERGAGLGARPGRSWPAR